MHRAIAIDETYHYEGYGGCASHCRVCIYHHEGRAPVIVASECDDNRGTSITNAATTLYPNLIATYLPGWLDEAERLTIIEHYSGSGGDTFDQVTFSSWRPTIKGDSRGGVVSFGTPAWRRMRPEQVVELIGE